VPFANLGGGGAGGGAAGDRQRDGAAELPREGVAAAAIGGGGAGGGNTSPPPVSFCDIMTVFQRAVREVRAGQAALEAGEARGGDSTYFNRTIVILLHLVCLFTKLLPHLEKEQVAVGSSSASTSNSAPDPHKVCRLDSDPGSWIFDTN
jgi:hypothetical protein